jgi:DNA primase
MEKNDWTISTETSRLLAPLYDFDGRRFGLNAKMLPGSEYPGSKSIKYLEEESLGIAFPRTNPSHDGTIVVVEDSISAVKLSQFINAVALLGTSMNEDQALFLASKYSHVIIALDPDAAMKAVWMLEKYKGVFEKISVVFLEKDPKDSAVIVLETKLGEVTDEPIGAGKCDC